MPFTTLNFLFFILLASGVLPITELLVGRQRMLLLLETVKFVVGSPYENKLKEPTVESDDLASRKCIRPSNTHTPDISDSKHVSVVGLGVLLKRHSFRCVSMPDEDLQ